MTERNQDAENNDGPLDMSTSELMREVWSLEGERADFPGALSIDGIHAGMRIARHFEDRVTKKWFSQVYDVLTDPMPHRPDEFDSSRSGFFRDDEHLVVLARPDYSELDIPASMKYPQADELSLSSAGIMPYNTADGPLWTTKVYSTEVATEPIAIIELKEM